MLNVSDHLFPSRGDSEAHIGSSKTLFPETYYVAARAKTLTPEQEAAVQDILKKNEVERDWQDVDHVSS